MITPNSFAFAALLSWTILAVALYLLRPAIQATIWTLIGAQMFLPVGTVIKFEMIPAFDKSTVPNLCILFGCIVAKGRGLRPSRWGVLTILLVCLYLVAPVFSVFGNGTPIFAGNHILPAADFYNAGSAVIGRFLLLIPFLVGREFFRSVDDVREVLKTMVVAAVAYSFLVMFELRFSPQLHIWLYGYSPTDYVQALRGDGYRPMVFMGHGLTLSFFLSIAAIAASVLASVPQVPSSAIYPALAGYLFIVLALCKSFGATLYAVVVLPIIKWVSPRGQVFIAASLIAISLCYPVLRYLDLFPTNVIVQVVAEISAERAESIKVRFDNEDQLLARASERALFGWGGYGRNRIYDDSGHDISITDGQWIATMGNYGILGFLVEFGLLALGVIKVASRFRSVGNSVDRIFLAGLSLMIAINVVELLPNSTLMPLTWFLTGTLLGVAENPRLRFQERAHADQRLKRSSRLIGAQESLSSR